MVLRRSYFGVVGFVVMMAMMFLGVQAADAASYYWVGQDADWTVNANWNTIDATCATSGDAGEVPDGNDTAIFGNLCDDGVNIPAALSLSGLVTETGYAGTMTQLGTVDVNGPVTIVSGATLNSNSFDLAVGGDWTNAGIYTSGTNTVTFDGASGTQTIDTGGSTADFDFSSVVMNNTGTKAVLSNNDLTVNGTLTIYSGTKFGIDGQNLDVTGTYSNNGGYLELGGGEAVTLTDGMDTDSGTTSFLDTVGGTRALGNLTSFYDIQFEDTPGGITWALDANIDVNGSLNLISGTLNSAGYDITLAGDWTNAGTFTQGIRLVTLDGASQTITGDTTFYDFTKSVSSADTLTLASSSTTTITNDLVLNGAAGARLTVAASTSTAANLDMNGTATVSYLIVTNNTTAGSVTPSCLVGCSSGGGNTGWIFPSTGGTSSTLLSNSVTVATLLSPNGGEALTGGETSNITWSVGGDDVSAISLYYSVDNGLEYVEIATDEDNDGEYSWTIPNIDATSVNVMVAGVTSAGSVVVTDVSNQSFSITMNNNIPADVPAEPVGVDTSSEVESTSTITVEDIDGNMVELIEGSLFRGVSLSGVYFVKDGTRYVFPNEAVFNSHGYSFDDVSVIRDDDLRVLKIGGRMIMAEGSLVKIQSDNHVYQVQAGGVLSHVPDEDTAFVLYGANWNQQITDISVTFWFDYTLGTALAKQAAPVVEVVDVMLDSDSDGLTDIEEATYGTDINDPDTDGDGYSDKVEIDTGHDPLS